MGRGSGALKGLTERARLSPSLIFADRWTKTGAQTNFLSGSPIWGIEKKGKKT